MSHNSRIFPDSYYLNGVAIPASYFQALDTAQSKLINGDGGGIWPGALTIGGAGMWCTGPWGILGSGIYNASGSGARLVHGDSDYVVLESGHPAASRNLVSSFGNAVDASYVSGNSLARMVYENVKDGLKNQSSNTSYQGGGRLVLPLRAHHGATLTAVTIYFVVTQSRTALPVSQPKARVIQVDAAGNVTPLCSTAAAGYVGNGFIQAAFANAASYYNSGNANSLALAIVPGTIVDTTKYTYYVQVEDEADGNGNAKSGNEYLSAVAAYSSIPDLRPQ